MLSTRGTIGVKDPFLIEGPWDRCVNFVSDGDNVSRIAEDIRGIRRGWRGNLTVTEQGFGGCGIRWRECEGRDH